MFLQMLNTEQKELFILLAFKAAEANGIVDDQEKVMMEAFGKEVGIAPVSSTNASADMLIDKLRSISSEKELRIIAFETFAILISDSVVDEKEKEFFSKVVNGFSISKEDVAQMESLIGDYTSLYKRIYDFLLT